MATATKRKILFIQRVHERGHALATSRGDVTVDAPKHAITGSAEIH